MALRSKNSVLVGKILENEENKRKVGHPFAENPKRSPVTIRLTADDYSRLKEYSERHSKTMTQVIMEGIELVYAKG